MPFPPAKPSHMKKAPQGMPKRAGLGMAKKAPAMAKKEPSMAKKAPSKKPPVPISGPKNPAINRAPKMRSK